MSERTIPGASMPGWSPPIHVSPQVEDRPALGRFVERTREGFAAPAIRFLAPQPAIVAGRHFSVTTRAGGLFEESIHTLGPHHWHQLFHGLNHAGLHPAGDGEAVLIVGNSGQDSFYHFTVETLGPALVRRLIEPAPVPLALPALNRPWQRALVELHGIDEPLIEIATDELAAFDAARLTNLTGRAFGFAPHPLLLEALGACAGTLPPTPPRRRLYLSRADTPGRRRMTNEAALCDLLMAEGFEILVPGTMSVAEQAAMVRAAELIVAPHGAALTNLVYARDGQDGPRVLELLPEDYMVRLFLKIGQAKRLDHRAIVNPRADVPSRTGDWRCDLDLVRRTLAEWGRG